MLRIRHFILATVVPSVLVILPPSADAAKRTSGSGVGQCWIEGTANPAGPGEAISSCCLEDGCWICSATWDDCTWDPKVGARAARKGTVGVVPGGQVLDSGGKTTTSPAGRAGNLLKRQ